jgi:hypothetical protein
MTRKVEKFLVATSPARDARTKIVRDRSTVSRLRVFVLLVIFDKRAFRGSEILLLLEVD